MKDKKTAERISLRGFLLTRMVFDSFLEESSRAEARADSPPYTILQA